MVDSLDDMLLEAAGRPKGGLGDSKGGISSRPSKRRSHGNDSSSDDRSGGSENDFDDDDDYERGGSSRKAEGSSMPLKKRFDSADKDGEEGDRDSYETDISYGSDLYKDEEDRRRLAEMTELEREIILADRAEARDNYKMRKVAGARRMLQNRAAKSREKDAGPPSTRIRSSFRDPTQRSSKDNALHELVRRRQRAQDPDLQRKRDTPASGARDRDRRASARKSRNRSYSDSDYSDDDDVSSREDDDRSGGSDDDDLRKGEPDADWQDIKSITIRRSKLHKWFMEPFFEDVIVGCYVRIGIGVSSSGQSIYRVCLVKNVDATAIEKQYKFENRMTHKYLNCVWGDENSAARWQMVRASDQSPAEKEVLELFREIERSGGKKPSKADVQEKKDAIGKVNSFVYSAATVKQMLQEKKSAASRPSNIALEKDRTTKELAVAEEKGDQHEIDKLQTRLKELEELSAQVKSKDAKAFKLAEMNRRNKYENFKNASDMKPVNTDAKAGEAGYDPFSRRWTRSQNYYKKDGPKESAAEETEGQARLKSATVPPEAAAQIKVPHGVAKTKMFELHDFDINISLAPLKQYVASSQGAHVAYMTRKQKLESCFSSPVDGSDGRRHTLTLTVNDYKRRRGLI